MITDRRRYGPAWEDLLVTRIAAAARAGVHLLQVRERDLDAADLLRLVRRCLDAVRRTRARVLVNDRLDVALAAGAHGVHLRGDSMPAPRVRAITGAGFLIGRSIHSTADATAAAAAGGLDYLLFGTVFATASKPGRPAAGLDALREAAQATRLPVLAVGGMSRERWPEARAAGAAGFAAIAGFA